MLSEFVNSIFGSKRREREMKGKRDIFVIFSTLFGLYFLLGEKKLKKQKEKKKKKEKEKKEQT